uniref:Ras family GTPase n=1 Tax=Pithovirus LCPAC304 TaxID=2506594 RepID=A0A481Z8R9_9VIRU|nr:MAG: Ras family GTPase [Pithovirus LCPAC304]
MSFSKDELIVNIYETLTKKYLCAAGVGAFDSMQELYIKRADGIILLFSLISPSTLDECQHIHDTIVSVGGSPPPPIILGGTKRDLRSQRQITFQEAYTQAQQWGYGYVEISSKQNFHVDHIFEILIQQISRDWELMRSVPSKHHKRCILF